MGARLLKRALFWAFPLLLGVSLAPQVLADSLTINQFGGLNTDHSPATLQGGATPDSENVVTDEGPGLRPRDGFSDCAASSATAQWNYPHSNGTRYRIIQSGGVLKADTGSCSFSVTVSTVDASVNTVGAVLGDVFYFANTTDGLKSWDTASVSVASAALKVNQLVTHKARLWAAGLASQPRTIFASKFGDGTTWNLVTDPAVTDPAQFQIGGAVDEPLTALYASHQDALIWMKPRSFGSVPGDDRSSFKIRTYSDNVGTAYPDSIQNCDGLLRWLGPARTIYEWNGAQLSNIGLLIKTLLSAISQGDANSRTYSVTTQEDYEAGTAYQLTARIVSGDLHLSTWTATDTTTADFTAGSASNVTVANDRVQLSTTNVDVQNSGFESAIGSEWTFPVGTGFRNTGSFPTGQACGSLSPTAGNGYAVIDSVSSGISYQTYVAKILDANDNVLVSGSSFGGATTNCAWNQSTFSAGTMASYAGRFIKIGITYSGGSTYLIKSAVFLGSGSALSFYYSLNPNTSAGSAKWTMIDVVAGGRSDVTSGTFTSRTFDTVLTSAAWLSSGASWTTNGHSITAQTQSSSDGSSWQTAVSWSTGSAPSSDFRRHGRYVLTISTGNSTAGTGVPYVDDVALIARSNYGAYLSTPIALGNISSFGLFDAQADTNGATVAYAIYTDSNTAVTVSSGVPTAGFVSSQTITSGDYPTVSTAAYVRLAAVTSISVATHTPVNHSLSIAWSEGITTKTPSAWFRQRYWLGVSQNSTTNNRVLVFDRNRQWQRYSGVNASTLGIWDGSLFFGNSSGVFQYESGYSDAGTAIAAYFRTATFSPAGPNLISSFDNVRVTADNSTETLGTSFQVNGVTSTDYDLGDYDMDTVGGIQNFKLAFPFSQVQQGRNISLRFDVSGTTFWRILGATLDFVPDVVPD